ncbi:hypothetical protein [Sinomonas albida]|uniref:hypothetical protein n=1 Tax=Sinomonas albida TaxID=369942 RepID=UPI0010A83ADE|nr:hypothetical protein [Sinomonas albida]
MGIRIYDAEFGIANGSDHEALAKFWWKDDLTLVGSTWTKTEAYTYVVSKPEGWVYVSENGSKVTVWGWVNRPGVSGDFLV